MNLDEVVSEIIERRRSYGQQTHLRFRGRGVSPTEGSCRFPLIVLQQTTQSFLATHNSAIPARPSIRQGEQEPVLLALVIALLVVMGHILLQGSAQRSLPEQVATSIQRYAVAHFFIGVP
jgi:hypothetical protein